jgi:hypothetical protein
MTRCSRDSTYWWSCTISRHQERRRRNEEGVLRLPIRSTHGAGITAIGWPEPSKPSKPVVSDGPLGCLRSWRGGLQELPAPPPRSVGARPCWGRLFGFHPRSPTLPHPAKDLSRADYITGTTVGFEGFEGGRVDRQVQRSRRAISQNNAKMLQKTAIRGLQIASGKEALAERS